VTQHPGSSTCTETAAFRLGGHPIWPDANRIGGRHVEPKSMAVLLALVKAAPAVVPLPVLIEQVWKNVSVSDSVVHRAVSQLRQALGDDARRPRCIETIPRRGYRLITPAAGVAGAAADAAAAQPLLAVLPFDNLSNDEDLRYFSDGVSEEILQTVARSTGVRVIGRSSSFQFRGADKSTDRVSEVLGCTHLLDGSVRRSLARIRVSAQLIDCRSRTTLWSERYDYALADVFDLQDRVAEAVARALRLTFAPSTRAGPIDPGTYELYLQAKASTSQWLGASDVGLLEQAVAREPSFAQAWAALAISRAVEAHVQQDAAITARARDRAVDAARTALRLDRAAGAAYVALSIVEPVCGRFAERDSLIASALAAAPDDPVALFWASRWSWTVGRLRDQVDHLGRACGIDPLWPQGLHAYASALWTLGRRSEACDVWDRTMARWPQLPYLYAAQIGFAASSNDWPRVDIVINALRASGLDSPETERNIHDADRIRRWSEQDSLRLLESLEAGDRLITRGSDRHLGGVLHLLHGEVRRDVVERGDGDELLVEAVVLGDVGHQHLQQVVDVAADAVELHDLRQRGHARANFSSQASV
jgi:TolB-like protein